MNKKSIILCSLITLLLGILVIFCFMTDESYSIPSSKYQVYLNGEKIGVLDNKDALYDLINKEQIEIKNEYDVDQVYPPKGFEIVEKTTYNDDIVEVEDVYNAIKDEKDFTLKGYTITIKSNEENVEPTYIYVLDEGIFEEAVKNIVKIFIGEDRFEQYMENTQPEIVDVGYIIENMYFDNNITIKESYVNVSDKIYTDVDDLTKYLLFKDNTEGETYTVKQGDTLENVAESHKLNIDELLYANDSIKSEDTLLAIGQKLNVTLIDPVLSLVYEEYVVQDVEEQYQKVVEKDSSQYVGYSKVKQKGVNGINRVTSRIQYTNGDQNAGVKIIGDPVVIKAAVDEITIQGTKKKSSYTGGSVSEITSGTYIDTGQAWAWPTKSPYVISSGYKYRWGTLHDGIDISGTGGVGSPIYAALDGVVVNAQWGGIVGNSAGYNVVIRHSNGYYTVYAHLSKILVSSGQTVSRRQKIGLMGCTGSCTGPHLHFGVFIGKPYNGGKSINPLRLWS